ncbi:MAG: GntR family transcriptional regulator [Lentisphaeria bacterium]|nr:GntR family transcriptional regulator [Lentisphaeria bacterium]
MIRVFKHDQGRKTENLKRLLLQYIQSHGLKTGDRLPSQAVLRKQLGLSGTTIIRAIKSLESDRILEVRDKVGTFLAEDSGRVQPGTTVALLRVPELFRILPQYSVMMMILQNKLFNRGFQPVVFPSDMNSGGTAGPLAEFPKLRTALDQSSIDAVVDFYSLPAECCRYLLGKNVPYFRLSAVKAPFPGVYIDSAGFFRQALDEILDRGCRYPMLVTAENPELKELWHDLLQEKLPGFRKGRNYCFSATSDREGIQLALRLKNAPVRPDSFVFMDDSIGLYFLMALERLGLGRAAYDPFIVSTATAELPLLMPRDNIIYYEMNLDSVMERMLDLVRRRLDIHGRPQGADPEWYSLKRIGIRPLLKGPDFPPETYTGSKIHRKGEKP